MVTSVTVKDALGNNQVVSTIDALLANGVAINASLPVGNNQIGNVSITALPNVVVSSVPSIPVGGNQIGNVSITALPALPVGNNQIGNVSITALPSVVVSALPSGANQVGNVSITAMPNVVVSTLPSLPVGGNQVGNVSVTAMPSINVGSIAVGANQIGNVSVTALPAVSLNGLPTGANTIGAVTLPAGNTVIGQVSQVILPSVVSTVLESSHVLSAGPCTFYSCQVNTTNIQGWVLLFDSVTVPADGAVTPKKAWQLPAGSTADLTPSVPLAMANGAVIVFSTTGPFTKAASNTAYFSGEIK